MWTYPLASKPHVADRGVPFRVLRAQNTNNMKRKVKNEEGRFWSHVTKSDDGCWRWTGATNGHGYGCFWTETKTWGAHRYAYEKKLGAIPNGMVLDHLCRNRLCVNPEHLEIVPQVENVRRGESLAVANRAKTHCVNGHRFDQKNTYVRRRAWGESRECRKCHAEHEHSRKINRKIEVKN